MKYFVVEILTPSKIIAKGVQAESLLIPTIRGQINVLKDHTHIITKLSNGVLTVFGGTEYADRHFFVSEGICKILDNTIQILANTAEESVEVDVERAKRSLVHAEDKLKSTEGLTLDEIAEYEARAERAKLRIQIAQHVRSR